MSPGPTTTFSAGDSPGLALWRATLAWQRRVRAALEPLGLTHVQFVLLTVAWWHEEHGAGAATQTVVATTAGTDPMMTSQVLRRLEADGLVRREPHPDDARARCVGLTDEGRARLAAALPAVEAVDAEVFGRIPARERDAFVRRLVVLAAED